MSQYKIFSKKLFTFLLLLTPTLIFSQAWAPPGHHTRPNQDTFSYDAGVNKYNNDYYLYVAPTLNFNFDGIWGASLTLPLNFLAVDRTPKEDIKVGQLRKVDYDQKSDYLRLLNYVWYGTFGEYKPGELTYSAYVGKMFDAYIGHGTIINRYVNNQRIDVYKAGVIADFNSDYGGVQVFTNSIYDREVNSGRAYIRPYGIVTKSLDLIMGTPKVAILPISSNVVDEAGRRKVGEEFEESKTRDFELKPEKEEEKPVDKKKEDEKKKEARKGNYFDPDSIFNRFALGYTVAYDGKAPKELDFDTTGHVKIDSYNNPKVKSSVRLAIEGYDVEFKVFSYKYLEVTPYYDVNRIKGIDNSKGTHYGSIFRIGGKQIYLILKPELREMYSAYMPMYFDSYYEVERLQSNLETSLPMTKYQVLKDQDPDKGKIKGYYHTAVFRFYNMAAELSYENYEGKNNSRVFAGLYFPIGKMFLLSGYYMKKGFDTQKEAFKIDDKVLAAGELAVKIGPIAVRIANKRRWIMDPDTGKFEAKDEQTLSVTGGTTF